MNKRKYFHLLLLLSVGFLCLAIAARFFARPASSTPYYFLESITQVQILGVSEREQTYLRGRIGQEIERLENIFSLQKTSSELSALNQKAGQGPVPLSDDLYFVLEKAQFFSQKCQGQFDVTIGPLSQLWGIGTDHPQVPSLETLQKALTKVDYRRLQLDPKEKTATLPEPGIIIDLGAIAKGYVTDRIASLLREENVPGAIIDMGGNLYLLGDKKGQPFTIGIQHPDHPRGQYFATVSLRDVSVVTSGSYERVFTEGGHTYHHILSPKTGFPAQSGLCSVTVFHPSSTYADALSTAAFVAGPIQGRQLVESVPGAQAVFVTDKKQVLLTAGLQDRLRITDPSFKLISTKP